MYVLSFSHWIDKASGSLRERTALLLGLLVVLWCTLQMVHFRRLEKPKENEFVLELYGPKPYSYPVSPPNHSIHVRSA